MTKNSVKLMCRLTTIATALSAFAGTTLAGPCPMRRHKPAVAFYQHSTNSHAKSGSRSVYFRHQQTIESDNAGYEPPSRPGFDPYLR
jgi:hypothetical protein